MITKVTIGASIAIGESILLTLIGCDRSVAADADLVNESTLLANSTLLQDSSQDQTPAKALEPSEDLDLLLERSDAMPLIVTGDRRLNDLGFVAHGIDSAPPPKNHQSLDRSVTKATKENTTDRVPAVPLRAQTAPQTLTDTAQIAVNRIELKCGLAGENKSCIFNRQTPEIAAYLKTIEGKTVTVLQIKQLSEQITKLYNTRGYITSGAIIYTQNVDNGVITINTIEGGIEDIRIEGLKLVKPEYLSSRIREAIAKAPVKVENLDERLRLLRSDPLFKSVDFQIVPGSRIDRSILKVKVTEAPSIGGAIGFDNFSPTGIGSEKLAAAVSFRNWSFSGDRLLAGYRLSSTGGSKIYEFSYDVPLSSANDVLQVRSVINDFKLTDPQLVAFNINGKSNLYEVNYRRPIVRSTTDELNLSVAFTYQDNQIFLGTQPVKFDSSADDNGSIRTSVVRFSQDYTKRDARGSWVVRSNFNFGTGLFNATQNSAPIPDGRFFNWTGQAQRWHRLSDNNLLVATLSAQLSPMPLMQSQQFYFSDDRTIRGYRQNVRVGDNGVTLSLEDRITLGQNRQGDSFLQLIPFVDAGIVWNHPNNPNNIFLANQNLLIGAGVGVNWVASPQFDLRVDFALPLVSIKDRGNNLQDNSIYLRSSYRF